MPCTPRTWADLHSRSPAIDPPQPLPVGIRQVASRGIRTSAPDQAGHMIDRINPTAWAALLAYR